MDIDMEDEEEIYRPKRLRKVSNESSLDEEEKSEDIKGAAEVENVTPAAKKRPLATLDDYNTTTSGSKYAEAESNLKTRFSEEMTAISDKHPGPCEPGMKWVKVKKTEMKMDSKGYMITEDVQVWEQQPAGKKLSAAAKRDSDQQETDKKQAGTKVNNIK